MLILSTFKCRARIQLVTPVAEFISDRVARNAATPSGFLLRLTFRVPPSIRLYRATRIRSRRYITHYRGDYETRTRRFVGPIETGDRLTSQVDFQRSQPVYSFEICLPRYPRISPSIPRSNRDSVFEIKNIYLKESPREIGQSKKVRSRCPPYVRVFLVVDTYSSLASHN